MRGDYLRVHIDMSQLPQVQGETASMSALERGGPTLQPSAAVLSVSHGIRLHLHICALAKVS